MAGQLRLRDYPFVVVRFACRDCPRIGRYRLAVLAERFGADALMPDVLNAIAATCPRTHERYPDKRCQAYLPDLTEPRPPDLPVVAGGCSGSLAPTGPRRLLPNPAMAAFKTQTLVARFTIIANTPKL